MKHIPNGITRFNQVQKLDSNLRKMYDVIGSLCRKLQFDVEEEAVMKEDFQNLDTATKIQTHSFIYFYVLNSEVRGEDCFGALHSLLTYLHFINENIEHSKYVTWKDGHDWGELYRQVKFDLEQIQEGLKNKND